MAVSGVNAVETYRTQEYANLVEMLVQQKGSKLRPFVINQGFTGKAARMMQQVGEAVVQKVTTRHGDTPLNPIPADGRWVYPTHWDTAELLDKADDLERALSLEGPYAMAQAMAMGRQMDSVIIDAALGDAKTGETGSTTTGFPAAQAILNGGTAMTIDKLREAREKFLDADVDLDGETVIAAITPKQQTQLLETTQITSSDYNTVKALVNGEVNSFMGFRFIVSNRLPGASNDNTELSLGLGANIESAVFFAPSGVGLGIWDDLSSRVEERPDKRYAKQIYTCASFGATRLQEDKVIRVDSDATA